MISARVPSRFFSAGCRRKDNTSHDFVKSRRHQATPFVLNERPLAAKNVPYCSFNFNDLSYRNSLRLWLTTTYLKEI